MTREEAIKELERTFDVLDLAGHMDNRRKEAFNMARVALSAKEREAPDMAIKVLEQESALDKAESEDKE